MVYNITKNEQYNSIELTFDGKPDEKIRDALKKAGYRWHGVRRIWYYVYAWFCVYTGHGRRENG